MSKYLFEEFPLVFVSLVELLELLSPAVLESRRLVRTHEAPDAVRLDPLHEEVRDPHGVEQVPGAVLLLAVVLPQIQELKDVGVPRLEVDGKGAGSLVASLVNVPGGVVVNPGMNSSMFYHSIHSPNLVSVDSHSV